MNKLIYTLLITSVITITCLIVYSNSAYHHLKAGDTAPGFTALATSQDTIKKVHLSDYRGQKVILFFYPWDDSPYCRKQAKSLKEKHEELKNLGYVVLGVNTNSISSHQAFIKKHDLPFLLISDKKRTLHNLYSTWQRKFFVFYHTRRITFIINEEGKIQEIITKVLYETHADQIIAHHQ